MLSGQSPSWEDEDALDECNNDLLRVDSLGEEEEEEGNELSDCEDSDLFKMGVLASTPPMMLFLAAHGLSEYVPLFNEEKIDLEALVLLTEQDLKSLGLPLGPRKKLMTAIEKRRARLREPGLLHDTDL